MLGFEFFCSGISWCRLNNEKNTVCISEKKSLVFFIQILIIWQKIKEEEKERGGGGFHISFFYSLKKSIVLRLTELCRRCKSWSNKLSVLLLQRSYTAEEKVHGSQSPFCAANFQVTQPGHSSAGKNLSLSVTKFNSKTVNVSWKQTKHVPELKGL